MEAGRCHHSSHAGQRNAQRNAPSSSPRGHALKSFLRTTRGTSDRRRGRPSHDFRRPHDHLVEQKLGGAAKPKALQQASPQCQKHTSWREKYPARAVYPNAAAIHAKTTAALSWLKQLPQLPCCLNYRCWRPSAVAAGAARNAAIHTTAAMMLRISLSNSYFLLQDGNRAVTLMGYPQLLLRMRVAQTLCCPRRLAATPLPVKAAPRRKMCCRVSAVVAQVRTEFMLPWTALPW